MALHSRVAVVHVHGPSGDAPEQPISSAAAAMCCRHNRSGQLTSRPPPVAQRMVLPPLPRQAGLPPPMAQRMTSCCRQDSWKSPVVKSPGDPWRGASGLLQAVMAGLDLSPALAQAWRSA